MIKPLMNTDKKIELLHKNITEEIIQSAYKVHNTLGPGYLEIIYHNALVTELRKRNLKCDIERIIEIFYEDNKVGEHRLDLIVENRVVVELKSVSDFHPAHQAQIISYLKASGMRVGLLFNFGKARVEHKRYVL